LTPETCGPLTQESGQAPACPSRRRGASDDPMPGATDDSHEIDERRAATAPSI